MAEELSLLFQEKMHAHLEPFQAWSLQTTMDLGKGNDNGKRIFYLPQNLQNCGSAAPSLLPFDHHS